MYDVSSLIVLVHASEDDSHPKTPSIDHRVNRLPVGHSAGGLLWLDLANNKRRKAHSYQLNLMEYLSEHEEEGWACTMQ